MTVPGALRQSTTRGRIVRSAAELIATSPTGEVPNRAICEAAGVTPPTLYHHFKDKDGLIEAVVTDAFERYLARKRAVGVTGDLLVDFRLGWEMHVKFGIEHPALYEIMYGRRMLSRTPAAATAAREELLMFMRSFEAAGRLRVPIDLATDLTESAATGATLQLIRERRSWPDPATALAREAVIATLIAPAQAIDHMTVTRPVAEAARALRDALPRGPVGTLRASETAVLHDWIDELAGATDQLSPALFHNDHNREDQDQ